MVAHYNIPVEPDMGKGIDAMWLVALRSAGKADRLVATISQYRFAPETADQLKVGVTATPVALFDGGPSVGAGRRDCPAVGA